MSISTIGMIIWFGLFGVNYFTKIPSIDVILALVAMVIAVALIARN